LFSIGIITVKYVEQIEPLYVSLMIIKNAFEKIGKAILDKKPPNNCNANGIQWNTMENFEMEYNGKLLYE
jgi:hypothetical protein